MSDALLTIRDVVSRTGVEAATLRMWEQRHGFPTPQRLPSGHRRYSESDVVSIDRVRRERAAGMELRAAIEAVRAAAEAVDASDEDSIYACLRRLRPHLQPHTLPKPVLLMISHAIEDECGASAHRAMLFASFQRERYYRGQQARWRDLASGARAAIVLADFPEVRKPEHGPVEVPIDRSGPAGREWSVVCDAPDFSALLAAWERPGQDDCPDEERDFEVLWSVEPDVVRDGARVACAIVARSAPEIAEPLREELAKSAPPVPRAEAVTSLTNRMVAYVGGARPPRARRSSAAA